jgi:hypothetical protein
MTDRFFCEQDSDFLESEKLGRDLRLDSGDVKDPTIVIGWVLDLEQTIP